MSIPGSVYSPIGKIPVICDQKTNRHLDSKSLLGSFSTGERVIRLHSKSPIGLRMSVLGHEVMHSILSDTGVSNMMEGKLEEAVCDAFGTWLAGAIQSGAITITDPNW